MPNTEIFTRRPCLSLRLLTNVFVLAVGAVGCLAVDALYTCYGQEQARTANWKTGRMFQRQLQSQVGVSWGGANSLRGVTSNLAQYQGVAIFLDRRVDPDQSIQFAVQNTELWDLLRQLAGRVQQGICRIGPTIYIGPPQTAEVLATVAALREEEVAQRASPTARRLQRTARLTWPELTEPRELIRQLGDEYGIDIEGIEQIPLDLWPAVDLPPLNFAQQMTLVLAGFDLTFSFQPDATKVRLVPLPEEASLQRAYPLGGDGSRVVDELRRRFPAAQVSVQSGSVVVQARWEEHELIRPLVSGQPAPGKTAGRPSPKRKVRYKLAIENKPIGVVAAALAKNLGREVRYDPAVTNRLNELVSFQVEDATLDELLRAFLDPAGLSYQIDEQTLLILPGRSD